MTSDEMGQINWRELYVTMSGEEGEVGTLGEITDAETPDACIEQIDPLDAAGAIVSWRQYNLAAADEDPDYETPRRAVDWTGFRDALAGALARLNAS